MADTQPAAAKKVKWREGVELSFTPIAQDQMGTRGITIEDIMDALDNFDDKTDNGFVGTYYWKRYEDGSKMIVETFLKGMVLHVTHVVRRPKEDGIAGQGDN